jgi:2-polyprenyl-3-methyl-5-hydroxy-6-metoxy-1,4-benzoquinol methylase
VHVNATTLRAVSLVYRLLYRVGFTPWDTGEVPAELSALVEGETALAPERALDIGCGTGTHSLYLARNGWQVTGIEVVEQPLRRARARSAAEGVTVDWIRADASQLRDVGLTPRVSLMLDRGCYHGLSAPPSVPLTPPPSLSSPELVPRC